jgi:hypothetical protein
MAQFEKLERTVNSSVLRNGQLYPSSREIDLRRSLIEDIVNLLAWGVEFERL